jgi:hypothetical protein
MGKIEFVNVPSFKDARGNLLVCELGGALPFVPKRTFVISDVPAEASRAAHSVTCDLFLVALTGACKLKVVDGAHEEEHELLARSFGAYIPEQTWILLHDFAPGTIILAHASKPYREVRYTNERPHA